MWIAHAACAGTVNQQVSATTALMPFDIPSQPLPLALKAYSAATSLKLFYDTELVRDRRSSTAEGTMTPETALQALLQGTGLSAASFDQGTVTILAAPGRPTPVDLEPAQARAAPFMPYFALIQAGLRTALCRSEATALDPSERHVQLWFGPTGTVAQAALLTPTGSAERDRAYVDALQTISVAEPPPAAMPEPVTLVILPRTSADAAGCDDPASGW